LRREVKTAAKKSERENDHPRGLHNNLLIWDYPKRKSWRGQGLPGYLLLASRFRTSADNENVYEIWELYLGKHSTNNIFSADRQLNPNIFQERQI
jgi:hypothetical protein